MTSRPRARIAAGLLLACATAMSQPAIVRGDDLSFELPVIGETTFSMTSTTTLRYRGNNYDANPYDDDFGSLAQRFDLALQAEELRAEVRIDAFVPTTVFETRCPPETPELCYIAWDVRPERMTLRWEHEDWTVELGDSQLVLGRGIALAFRKVDLLGVDTALRGAHVRYDGDFVRARIHAGLANPQQQDPITLAILPEPEDLVVAGALGATIPGATRIDIGVHGARLWYMDGPDSFPSAFTHRAVDVAGWTLEAPALVDGRVALYAEANGLRRTQELSGRNEQEFGRAVYASAQFSGDELTILVEWKDYENFLVAPSTTESSPWRIHSAPPTIEYEGPQRIRGLGTQRGGGVRVDYAFLPGPWSFSVNSVLYGLDEENRDAWRGILVTHSWMTLARRQEYGEDVVWALNAIAGFRNESFLHDHPAAPFRSGDLDRRMVHGQIEVTVGSGEHSFDIAVDHRVETETRGSGGYRDFQVGGASVTYSFGVQLALTLSMRWSDFKQGEVTRREQPPYSDYNFLGGEWFPSIEARYSFDPGTFLRLFVGQTPGGQICSGGVCRDVPPFEGFLLQFVGRL